VWRQDIHRADSQALPGRRGARKLIFAADGSVIVASSRPQPDGTLVKALARASRWQKLLDEGVYSSVIEISEAEDIGKSYVSRILRLALLAPDIVEAILVGRTDQALMLEKLERPLPVSWVEQRKHLLQRSCCRLDAVADSICF